MTPYEACLEIANSFEDFLHHKIEWQDVLDKIQETIDAVCQNAYSVGRYSGIQQEEPEPWGIKDPQWQLQIRSTP